jgi:hypothetical protein
MFEYLQEDELDDQHTKAEFHTLRIYSSLPLKGYLVWYFSKEQGGGQNH